MSHNVVCAIQAAEHAPAYTLALSGPPAVTDIFRHLPRAARIAARLTWRMPNTLSLLTFVEAPAEPSVWEAYKKLFVFEVGQHQDQEDTAESATGEAGLYSMTPLRRTRAVVDAASELATPEPWNKRARTA